jgi:hypothetical protein
MLLSIVLKAVTFYSQAFHTVTLLYFTTPPLRGHQATWGRAGYNLRYNFHFSSAYDLPSITDLQANLPSKISWKKLVRKEVQKILVEKTPE